MEWLTFIKSLMTAPLSYFFKRHYEKRSLTEDLERRMKAVQLKVAMDEAGMTTDDVDLLLGGGSQRTANVRANEDNVSAGLPSPDPLEPMTQLEMNHAQQMRAEQAQMVLGRVTLELSGLLSEEDNAHLHAAVDAWQTLVENHAALSRNMFRGGSMAPMVYWAEHERMTVTRIAEIQSLIEERKSLFDL